MSAAPLPKNTRCHRCGEWFANAHVCADQVTLRPSADPLPTNAEIAERLRAVANEMRRLGAMMDYLGGFDVLGARGRALIRVSQIPMEWAQEIEEAQG